MWPKLGTVFPLDPRFQLFSFQSLYQFGQEVFGYTVGGRPGLSPIQRRSAWRRSIKRLSDADFSVPFCSSRLRSRRLRSPFRRSKLFPGLSVISHRSTPGTNLRSVSNKIRCFPSRVATRYWYGRWLFSWRTMMHNMPERVCTRAPNGNMVDSLVANSNHEPFHTAQRA